MKAPRHLIGTPGRRVEQSGKPVLRIGPERPRSSRPNHRRLTHSSTPNGATLDGGYVGTRPKRTSTTAAGPATATSTSPRQQAAAGSIIGRIAPELPDSVRRQHLRGLGRQRRFVWVGDQAAESVKGSIPRTATRSERSASARPASPAESRSMKETATCMSAPKTERSGSTRKRVVIRLPFCWPKTPVSSQSTRPKGSSTTSGPGEPNTYLHGVSTANGEPIEKVEALSSISTLLEVNPVNDAIYAFSGNGSYVFELPVSQVPKSRPKTRPRTPPSREPWTPTGPARSPMLLRMGHEPRIRRNRRFPVPGAAIWPERIGERGPAGDQ